RPLELGLTAEVLGKRVELARGVPGVRPGDQERRCELQQPEDQGDVDVADQLRAHEVTGEAGEHHVEQVPGKEGHGHGEGPRPVPAAQLTELLAGLYPLVDRGVVLNGHALLQTSDLDHFTLGSEGRLFRDLYGHVSPSRRSTSFTWWVAAVNGRMRAPNGTAAIPAGAPAAAAGLDDPREAAAVNGRMRALDGTPSTPSGPSPARPTARASGSGGCAGRPACSHRHHGQPVPAPLPRGVPGQPSGRSERSPYGNCATACHADRRLPGSPRRSHQGHAAAVNGRMRALDGTPSTPSGPGPRGRPQGPPDPAVALAGRHAPTGTTLNRSRSGCPRGVPGQAAEVDC